MADKISDTELRKELKAMGMENVGPITATTRPILMKKLNHLKAAKRKSLGEGKKAKPPRSMIGFSSDESEQEGDPKTHQIAATSSRRRSNRGKTLIDTKMSQNTDPNRSVSTRSPLVRSRRSDELSSKKSSTSRARQATAAKSIALSANGDGGQYDFSDSNESDAENDEVEEDDDEEDYSIHVVCDAGTNTSMLSDTSFSLNQSRLMDRSITRNDKDDDSVLKTGTKFSSPKNVFHKPSPMGRRSSTITNSQIKKQPTQTPTSSSNTTTTSRSNRSQTIGNSRETGSNSSSVNQNHVNNISKPSSANISKQSSVSVSKHREVLANENDITKEGFKTAEDPQSYRYTQYISLLLLFVAAAFFIALAFTYISMKGGESSSGQTKGNKLMVCSEAESLIGEKQQCFEKEQVNSALRVLNVLFVHLSELAGNFHCSAVDTDVAVESDAMDIDKLSGFVREQFGPNLKHYKEAVLLSLIHNNPHWNLRLTKADGTAVQHANEADLIVCDSPSIPFSCHIKLFLRKVIYGIMAVGVGVVVIALSYMYMRYSWRKQEEETKNVYHLVERIIDICKQQQDRHSENKNVLPYIPIPHIRDMLIPPSKRRQMQKLWDKAVKFLTVNESRIREESQIINGEEFSVWRWTQIQVDQNSSNGNKVWQGQAFGENKDLSMNMPMYSFTQCLKIRNMFDPDIEYGNDWHVSIQDAILEKCKDHGGIVHIAVDKSSKEGCVYLKCVDTESAGRAYKALHGWWFDGCLVTVKYLKLKRYYERFPDAVNCTTPLSPSTNQMRSLSQPYHRSSLECM